MEESQALRTAVYQALSNVVIDGKIIPVFDSNVNPAVSIPVIQGASCYIVMQDQQTTDAPRQNFCKQRYQGSITLRIVTKFATAGATNGNIKDSIADRVKQLMGGPRNKVLTSPYINIQKTSIVTDRNIDEFREGNTALSRVVIYSITFNKK